MKKLNPYLVIFGALSVLALVFIVFNIGKQKGEVTLPTGGEGIPSDWDIDKTATQLERVLGFWSNNFSLFFAISTTLSPDQRALIANYWEVNYDRSIRRDIEKSFWGTNEQVALDLYTF